MFFQMLINRNQLIVQGFGISLECEIWSALQTWVSFPLGLI